MKLESIDSGLSPNVVANAANSTISHPLQASPPSSISDFGRVSSDSSRSIFSDSFLNSIDSHDDRQSRSRRRHAGWVSQLHHNVVVLCRTVYVANYGALLVLCAQFFGSLMNLSTRLLETPGTHGTPMHPFQILFARQSITATLCTGYALYTKSIPDFPLGPPEVRWLLVTRGLTGFFGVFGLYFSLRYLPLSEATVLTFLSPILTCYACSLLMPGETFTRHQQYAGYISLVGVVFIAQPVSTFRSALTSPADGLPASASNSTFNGNITTTPASGIQTSFHPTPRQHLTAIGIAMIGVLGATGAMTSIRYIGTRAHPLLSINYFSVWCTIVSLACLTVFPDVQFRLPGNVTEWGLLTSLGLCGFIMQFLLTAGLAYSGPVATTTRSTRSPDVGSGYILRDIEHQPTDLPPTILPSPSTSPSTPNQPRNPDRNPNPVTKQSRQSQFHPHPHRLRRGGVHADNVPSSPPQRVSGNRATSMVFTQMLFALAGDKLVFGVTPDVMSWLGSGLILTGAVWVAAARDQTKPEESSRRREEDDSSADEPEGAGMVRSATLLETTPDDHDHDTDEVVGLMSAAPDRGTDESDDEHG